MNNFSNTCEYCGTSFVTEYETKRYCNRRHKEQAYKARRYQTRPGFKPLLTKSCPACNENFQTRNIKKIYCSGTCQEWMRGQYRRERDRQYVNQRTPAFKARIYFRSSGKCGICNEPIDTSLRHPDPMSLSLDHIVPRSKGGGHSAANLQASHLSCNVRKGNG